MQVGTGFIILLCHQHFKTEILKIGFMFAFSCAFPICRWFYTVFQNILTHSLFFWLPSINPQTVSSCGFKRHTIFYFILMSCEKTLQMIQFSIPHDSTFYKVTTNRVSKQWNTAPRRNRELGSWSLWSHVFISQSIYDLVLCVSV